MHKQKKVWLVGCEKKVAALKVGPQEFLIGADIVHLSTIEILGFEIEEREPIAQAAAADSAPTHT